LRVRSTSRSLFFLSSRRGCRQNAWPPPPCAANSRCHARPNTSSFRGTFRNPFRIRWLLWSVCPTLQLTLTSSFGVSCLTWPNLRLGLRYFFSTSNLDHDYFHRIASEQVLACGCLDKLRLLVLLLGQVFLWHGVLTVPIPPFFPVFHHHISSGVQFETTRICGRAACIALFALNLVSVSNAVPRTPLICFPNVYIRLTNFNSPR
jgi:hypothetical protein